MGDPVAIYHQELVRRLRTILGERVQGVYASGSFVLGDFDPSRSDLDVCAVVAGEVLPDERRRVVESLRHEALPCPARGLEFVLYPEETARVPTSTPAFLVNLNTGPETAYRFDASPGAVEDFWFPIDRAVVRQSGIPLFGPPASELFAPIPRRLLLPTVHASLRWHADSGGADAVLNACRALLWLREDRWASKGAAGEWARRDNVVDPELVASALAKRTRDARLDQDRVRRFVADAIAEVERAQRELGGSATERRYHAPRRRGGQTGTPAQSHSGD